MAQLVKVVRVRCEKPSGADVQFLELVLDGTKLKLSCGVIDHRTHQTRYYERSGERVADAEAGEKRIAEILASRGPRYKTQTRDDKLLPARDETLAPGAFHPELEAQVVAGSDPSAAAVYTDWLQTQGDLRGELAAVHATGDASAIREFLDANETRLFGELDTKLDSELYDLAWQHGLLRGASLKRAAHESKTDLAELTQMFLALPVARCVTALRFGLASYESDNDWTTTMAAVAGSRVARQLRSLRFDDYTSEDCELSWTAFGDFSPYWTALPALEELVIKSGEGGNLGELALPSLRKFVRESGALGEAEIESILRARWPKLEHLEIWFGSSDYGAQGTVAHVTRLLEGAAPPSLVHLGLRNCEFVHELLAPLARSPLLRQLRTLDLSLGVLRDGDVDTLLAHADAFAHLGCLDVSMNQLAGRDAEIVARLPNAVVTNQRYVDGDEDRYVAVGE